MTYCKHCDKDVETEASAIKTPGIVLAICRECRRIISIVDAR